MKRFFALLLTIALVFTLAACATEPEGSKKERKRSTAVDAAIFTIYVNYSKDMYSYDTEEDRPTFETIRDIITSNNCLEEAADRARELGATPPQISELQEMIYVTAPENSDVIQIGVAAGDEELSITLAKALCDVVPMVINQIVIGTSTKILDMPYMGTMETA